MGPFVLNNPITPCTHTRGPWTLLAVAACPGRYHLVPIKCFCVVRRYGIRLGYTVLPCLRAMRQSWCATQRKLKTGMFFQIVSTKKILCSQRRPYQKDCCGKAGQRPNCLPVHLVACSLSWVNCWEQHQDVVFLESTMVPLRNFITDRSWYVSCLIWYLLNAQITHTAKDFIEGVFDQSILPALWLNYTSQISSHLSSYIIT